MHSTTLTGVLAILATIVAGAPSPNFGPPFLEKFKNPANTHPSMPNDHSHPPSTNSDPDPRFQNHPVPHPHATIQVKRADVHGFYECSEKYFKGDCRWTQIKPGEKKCYNRLFKAQGSWGPDRGVTCTLFEAPDCDWTRTKTPGFTFPGSGDYANDKAFQKAHLWVGPGSWICDVTG